MCAKRELEHEPVSNVEQIGLKKVDETWRISAQIVLAYDAYSKRLPPGMPHSETYAHALPIHMS
jgi:hypothetical protein